MKKLDILFDANPLCGQKTGVAYYTESLVNSLAKYHGQVISLKGYYFNFLNKKTHPALNPAIRFLEIKIIPGKVVSLLRRLGLNPPLGWIAKLKNEQVVVYTNYVYLPPGKNREVVSVIYDLSFLDCPQYLQDKNLVFLKKYVPVTIKNSDLIITISNFTKKRLLENYPFLNDKKIVVTPIPPISNDIEEKSISKELKSKGINENQYILYVGTIEPKKNLLNLVKAYEHLDEYTKNKFALVLTGGKGWKDEEILSSIESAKARGSQIILTGYISNEDKSALYQNASLFVLPSHYECFGMPILEAMTYKIPVIVSDIEVFHEVAGDAAVYFDQNDPKDIAQKIKTVLKDDKLQKTLISNSRKCLDNYSWEKVSDIVYDAFYKLINN